MVELEIEAKVDTKEATSSVDKLVGKIDKFIEAQGKAADEQKKNNKEVKEGYKDTAKALKESEKASKVAARGFKGIGVALKSIGVITLLVEGFKLFKDILMQNQAVADGIATVFETISIIFNEVTSIIVDTFKSVSKATGGFEHLTAVGKGLLTIVLTPIKILFQSLVLGLKTLQLAWEESFFGDNDPETVKRLNLEIEQTKIKIAEVGIEAVEAGKSIASNISGAIDEVSKFGESAISKISEISISAAAELAKANVELKNKALLAEAELKRLLENYDRQAEKLRQVRDLESNSIDKRIEANEDLNKILDEQEKAMLAQANALVNSAQANFDKNKRIENQVALTKALAEKEGVLATIEVFRSEQQANVNSLTREYNDLNKTRIKGEQERAKIERESVANSQSDAHLRIEILRDSLQIERDVIAEDLEMRRELYKEGTQAREDAEQEYLNKIQEIRLQEDDLNKQSADLQIKLEEYKTSVRNDIIKKGLSAVKGLLGKQSEETKFITAADATRDTIGAIVAQLKNASRQGLPAPIAIGQAIATGIFGFSQVAEILSTSTPKTSSSSGSIPSVSSPSTEINNDESVPNFDFLNEEDQRQLRSRPQKSYVVNQDIQNEAALSQSIEDSASLDN